MPTLVCLSCRPSGGEADTADMLQENAEAKQMLQGIWVDKETETVSFRAEGDTIYYPDTAVVPVYFRIWEDTLYLGDKEASNSYRIDHMGEHLFKFHSATGEMIVLERSFNPGDTVYFQHRPAVPLTYNEVVKKDTVVYCGGERYHCYIYVNPSQIKVYKTSYTDEGIAVDNVYYDNIIHIAVYQGRTCIFSRDYSKKNFVDLIPEGFLQQAILSNMAYDKTDGQGFHFNATLCIPDDASCYMVSIRIDRQGEAHMNLIEY